LTLIAGPFSLKIREGSSVVPFYRFYKLDKRGHIEGLPEAIDCKDDADAIAKAEDRSTTRAIEIWDLGRRVAVIEPGAKIRRTTRRSPR
jgi:hypothetical protein